jgi:4-hydroxymandelate oxidase
VQRLPRARHRGAGAHPAQLRRHRFVEPQEHGILEPELGLRAPIARRKLSVENGVDGIIVSNHGGRGEDSGGATIDALPEVVQAVAGRIPVLVDSGFRRGTDILKALALGAGGVCIGRPYLWGLGAFGQEGVERVLELLRAEFEIAMRQCGVRSVKELSPAFVRRT